MIKYGIDISATGSIVSKDIVNIVIETKLKDAYFYNFLCILLIVSFVTIMAAFLYLNNKVDKEYEYKIKEIDNNDKFRKDYIKSLIDNIPYMEDKFTEENY